MERLEEDRVAELAAALGSRLGAAPEVAVILGSGWSDQAAGLLKDRQVVPLAELPELPLPRVEGHAAELQIGVLAGRRCLLQGGRVHAYEGYAAAELVRAARALARWGVPSLLLLNAAGGVRPDLDPGSLMPFADHINLGLPNPLAAPETPDGKHVFLDLVDLYDPPWREALLRSSEEVAAPGVYAGLPGPSYETPAEVARLAAMGASAVGMSTIPEAIAARAAGARVFALSLITNFAAGVSGSRPSHDEVLETASAHGAAAARVLAAAVAAAPTLSR